MKPVVTDSKKKFIAQLKTELSERLSASEAAKVGEFVDQFFIEIFVEEFAGRRISDVLGFVMTCWKFFQSFSGKQAKVEVFNPDLEQHGWQSTHTVIAILQTNMPFLIDSVRMALATDDTKIHGIQHAVIGVDRDGKGKLKSLHERTANIEASEVTREGNSLIFVEVDRVSSKKELKECQNKVSAVLTEVEHAVADYSEMKSRAEKLADDLASKKVPGKTKAEIEEAVKFIRWISDDRFTFLGYAEYKHKKTTKSHFLEQVKGTELGILRNHYENLEKIDLNELSPKSKAHITSKDLFIFAKSSRRSRVHRPAYPEYITLKEFNNKGEVVGEKRFLGLYTAKVYNERPNNIPMIRKKVEEVIQRSGMDIRDYSGKELNQILAVYPREELFQINVDDLYDAAMGTLYIQERRKIKIFMREDSFGRFVTAIVYVPRDIYSTDLRVRIQQILLESLNGLDADFTTNFMESALARTIFSIKVNPNESAPFNVADIEAKIVETAQSWVDDFRDSLVENYGEECANSHFHNYQNAFSASYKEEFSARRAAIDIAHIDEVNQGKSLSMSFYRALEEDDRVFHFKLFHSDTPVPLSDVMPIFDNMGFRVIGEHPYETVARDGKTVWLHDFTLSTAEQQSIDIPRIKEIFEELFMKVWQGEAENDTFNRLLMARYMDWRQIAMLRSYARYMRQIRVSNSQEFISNTIVDHADISEMLWSLFECRFDPAANKAKAKAAAKFEKLETDFLASLDEVQNLTEDKILRLYLDLIKATMRTNFYQPGEDKQDKNYICFKLQPRLIPNVPLPIPMFEIFVYSPRIEGVHLRGGKVARGGLRWSDRYEDYRTEVLGLVKAQQVKNAVIVPVGAKGGFVAKQLPQGDRDAFMKEGIACYQTFITALLDVTDNLVDGKVVPPKSVVRHDEDDYYLVVAADKGTATFSDIANEISENKGHWLGDAFASGGSQGYDHKKMGITAKGAWVSVERHFREFGHNTATTPFTAIGIGDMSGDVFGNGMLLSDQTKLVAAFNHLHIFVDPDPDPAKSFAERKRMFDLPRSSWEDYDAKLISKGGGVFSRNAKSLSISPAMKKLFDIEEDKLAPNDLIRYILKAQIDLLWFGGIGTYIKAETELDSDVGDKANDAVRINGHELRAKVVGEGGNLGMTQLGRIEYGSKGGRLNTDFIDNAGGVDCSDHEVNIKILLNDILQNGDLTEKQRNKLLVDMTQDVSDLVLKNNYRQTQAISVAHKESLLRMEEYRRLINALENEGKLNRELEFIPSDEQITERKSEGQGLTRPELSVLISYVKGDLKEVLNDCQLPDDPHLIHEIETVFPSQIVKKFNKPLHKHRLKREIIATQIANDMVNHMGISFVDRLKQSTGASTESIALAYIIARDVFRLEHWWEEIEKLDYLLSSEEQYRMMAELMSLTRRACRWLIRNRRSELNVVANMDKFAGGIDQISLQLPNFLQGSAKEAWQTRYDELVDAGASVDLARMVAGANHLYSALGIIEGQESTGKPLDLVANVYYTLGSRLELSWFSQQINALTPLTHWQALARESFREDLDWQQRALTVGLLKMKKAPKDVNERIEAWIEQHDDLVCRWQTMLTEFKATQDAEFSMYSVALRELLDLAQSTVHSAP